MEQINNIISEADMLKGNICRICVTDSEKELAEMYQWASRRLANLFMWNLDPCLNSALRVKSGQYFALHNLSKNN